MEILKQLGEGVLNLTWQGTLMMIIGGVLIYLAIAKDYEPMLLLPIGFGAILVNLPLAAVLEYDGAPGFLQILYDAGIRTELFPVLIFIAVGAMIDFTPLLKNPKMMFFGAAAQFGIFATACAALLLGKAFPSLGIDLKIASAIGVIGAADGPTSIFVATKFAPTYLGAISVAAYSYMSMVPIIQPPIIRMVTTKKERMIKMEYDEKPVSRLILILFPIVITVLSGILAPISVPLIGALMFGNLVRSCGVLEGLSGYAQDGLAKMVTLLLGLSIGASMKASEFLTTQTLMIMALGLFAFVFDTIGGIMVAKLFNMFSKTKINPMIGAAGISAFPMSSRIVHKMALKEDPYNFILMQATSANAAGQLGSVISGGMILALVPQLMNMIGG